MPRLTPSEFAAKWGHVTRTERAASQEHFIDLCRMLDVPTPHDADPKGEWYAFEKGTTKTAGGDGFADVWKRGHFAWEYKGKRKDLKAAYTQLLQYREALENPPCLVVCDMDRFEVHTNFTGTPTEIHRFTLADLVREPQEPLRVLRAVMSNPEGLRPSETREQLTQKAAEQFATLAIRLRERGHDPHEVAHFLNKVLFCLFAEDTGLLPASLVERLSEGTTKAPEKFEEALRNLFRLMSDKGGMFGAETIEWFNGGLFDGSGVLPLAGEDIEVIRDVSRLDWSEVEPAIFGTLFERGLDPENRTALGAHYTDRESIQRIIEPVVIDPLRREFVDLQERIEKVLKPGLRGGAATRAKNKADKMLREFLERLAHVRVLDPACGSGNFLYIALQALKDLERDVLLWGSLRLAVPIGLPQVGPEAVHGIEINDYAADLARVTIWIGHIQWMIGHGFAYRTNPILQSLDNIECRDALLDLSSPVLSVQAAWPEAEFIVGNPPFLGGKMLRTNLGDEYVDNLFAVYVGAVPREADFVTYWHEKARAEVEKGRVKRVGLLATQGIRGGASRRVLERVKKSGDIFMAWSDVPWVLDGAAVHVSFVGFDDGSETGRTLDGQPVGEIHANLTAGLDLTKAGRIPGNLGIAFMGDTKGGAFDLPSDVAEDMLRQPNPDGRSNRDILPLWLNGMDVTRRSREMRIIDFGVETDEVTAALYEAPFAYVSEHVKPIRSKNKRRSYAERWWLHVEPRPAMRSALSGLARFVATPTVAKHRLFAWLPEGALPDHQLIVFAREDDFTFGVLHSGLHEAWARGMGTQVREYKSGFRYTPTTTFETFPTPEPSAKQRARIEHAASELDRLREGWKNPGNVGEAELRRRTLTNLYNVRPAWLENCHLDLDRSVLAAYGWPEEWAEGLQPKRDDKGKVDPALGMADAQLVEEVLERLLALNAAAVGQGGGARGAQGALKGI